jgi:ribulose kinase
LCNIHKKKKNDKIKIIRGGLDAVALRIRGILTLVEECAEIDMNEPWVLFGSGGAVAKSELWRSILASATNRVIVVDTLSPELTLCGLALALQPSPSSIHIHSDQSSSSSTTSSSSIHCFDHNVNRQKSHHGSILETYPDDHCVQQYQQLASKQADLYEAVLSPSSDFSRYYF